LRIRRRGIAESDGVIGGHCGADAAAIVAALPAEILVHAIAVVLHAELADSAKGAAQSSVHAVLTGG